MERGALEITADCNAPVVRASSDWYKDTETDKGPENDPGETQDIWWSKVETQDNQSTLNVKCKYMVSRN